MYNNTARDNEIGAYQRATNRHVVHSEFDRPAITPDRASVGYRLTSRYQSVRRTLIDGRGSDGAAEMARVDDGLAEVQWELFEPGYCTGRVSVGGANA